MVSKIDRLQPSTIYGTAIQNYSLLDYDEQDEGALQESADIMAISMTVKARRLNGKGRGITHNDASEMLHALGEWLMELETSDPDAARAIYHRE